MTVDLSRYRYVPGESVVSDIDLNQVEIHDSSGQRVTEATLDAEADELARRYPNLRPGGKSLSESGAHSPRIQVVLSVDSNAEVHQRAKSAGVSVSKWARMLIERELAAV
ncbi:MAG: DNA-binding protein [Cellulomonadaceae bacterium]|jgi:hypothetical protein|nr:DNA-binding protein [Cellulomonadaceae bacterium]